MTLMTAIKHRGPVWFFAILAFVLSLACLFSKVLGEASRGVGWALLYFSLVIAFVEGIYWASTRKKIAQPRSPFEFPSSSIELDPQPLLLAEFEYARETAGQAMSDRNSMVGFYLLAFSIIATSVVELLRAEMGQQLWFPPFVGALLLWVLVIVGWLLYLTLIRLRQAWGESALAMNRIKAFFARHPKGATEGDVWAALRWRVETLPPLDRKWNAYHYSAVLLNLLNGMALACGALLIDTEALQADSARGPLIGIAAILGTGMVVYGCGMYRVFLCPPPVA